MEANKKSRNFGFLEASSYCRDRYYRKFFRKDYDVNRFIYHYTDINGLKGIVEKRGLWLSDAVFLNDTEELYNGKKITIELINNLKDRANYRNFNKVLLGVINKLESSLFQDNYVCSFSTEPDSLEQWRAYGNNGEGVCIEFDIKKKTEYPHFLRANIWQLSNVIYEDEIKNWIIHSIIYKYNFEYNRYFKSEKGLTHFVEAYVDSLFYSLVSFFINFKNIAFSEEKEVRLYYSNGDPLELFNKRLYRAYKNYLIPYVCTYDTKMKKENGPMEVDLPPISKIIVGPAYNQQVVVESIKYFIQDIGYQADIVDTSSIPYRG
ncbi:DUF2971 domain-containing protein [Eionea flava]